MGFIRKNYEIENSGISLDTAYAQIRNISIDIDGMAVAMFSIQKDRDSILSKRSLDTVSFRCKIDKEFPVYRQIYEKAKEKFFADWEDDIVEE